MKTEGINMKIMRDYILDALDHNRTSGQQDSSSGKKEKSWW
jgi:hypothetical protein